MQELKLTQLLLFCFSFFIITDKLVNNVLWHRNFIYLFIRLNAFLYHDVIASKITKLFDNLLRDCHSSRAMFRHLLHKYTIAIRMNYNVIALPISRCQSRRTYNRRWTCGNSIIRFYYGKKRRFFFRKIWFWLFLASVYTLILLYAINTFYLEIIKFFNFYIL